jgi:hypothetical protein
MPRQSPVVFHREMVDRILDGESFLSLVAEHMVP